MEENKIHKPLPLNINFQKPEDLLPLLEKKEYKKLLIEECYKHIKDNLKSDKISLFNIVNLGIIISIKSENFKVCLENILKHFESSEDYDSCLTVKELLKELTL